MITTIGAIARNLTDELPCPPSSSPPAMPPSPNRSPTYLALIGIMLRQTCPIQYYIMQDRGERGERERERAVPVAAAAAEYRISPTDRSEVDHRIVGLMSADFPFELGSMEGV